MKSFNVDNALETTGGDKELLLELLQLFADSKDYMIAQITTAIDNLDHDALHRSAHTLKGSLSSIGAEKSSEIASSLESMGMNNDFSTAKLALEKLQDELNSFENTVKEMGNLLEIKV